MLNGFFEYNMKGRFRYEEKDMSPALSLAGASIGMRQKVRQYKVWCCRYRRYVLCFCEQFFGCRIKRHFRLQI